MLDPEILKVLDSPWVQSKRDKFGREIWGFELKPGAPDEAVKAFRAFREAQAALDATETM